MNDKELADRVVALGVGRKKQGLFQRPGINPTWVDESIFVRDWRVAGALMEKVTDDQFTWFRLDDGGKDCPKWCVVETIFEGREYSNESLPRAIIEACVGALDEC